MIAELCAFDGVVLATGGGAVMRDANRKALHEGGRVVYLHASVEQQVGRTSRDRNRPLLRTANPEKTLRDLLASSMTPRVNDHLDGLAAVMTRLDCRWVIQVWAQDGHWQHNITPNVQPGPALEPILARGVDVRLSETRAREFARRFVSLIREMEDAQQEGEPVWSFTALLTPES